MYTTTFLYLGLISGLGASGSPLGHEKRQLIPFPQGFPFQTLSGDQNGALSAIRSNNLEQFCLRLMGGGQPQAIPQDFANLLPRQSVNVNSNTNQGGPEGSNSYSYSSSNRNGGGQSQTNVNYNLNGVSVPDQLTEYRPDTIENACAEFLGGATQGPQSTNTPTSVTAPGTALPVIPSPISPPVSAPTSLQPGIYFQNAFYGTGGDTPIEPIERPGLPPAPYVPGQFHSYRFACAEACAQDSNAFAFTVNTDFTTNHCNLVMGQEVNTQNGDIVPQDTATAFHLEAWNKYNVE